MRERNPASPKLAAVSNIPNDNLQSRADHLEARGAAHQAAGHFLLARKFYQRWHQLIHGTQSALRLGDVNRQLEQFDVALLWYRRAEKSAKKYHSHAEILDARLGQAMCLRGLEQYSSALRLLQACSTAYKRTNDKEGLAYTLWAIGTTQRFAGQFGPAERHLRQSIRLYKKLKDESGLAYARCGLGGTLRMKGRYSESHGLYRNAHRHFKKMRDRFGEAYSNCGQGNALRMLEKIGKAIPYMKKAELLYRSLRQKGPLAFVLWSRAQADIALAKFNMAKKRLAESRRIFEKVADPRGLVYCDLGEGQFYAAQDDRRKKFHFRRALNNSIRFKLPFEQALSRRRLLLKKSPCKIIEIP